MVIAIIILSVLCLILILLFIVFLYVYSNLYEEIKKDLYYHTVLDIGCQVRKLYDFFDKQGYLIFGRDFNKKKES